MRTKLLLTVLTMFTLLFLSINSISAFEFDNVKSYDEETRVLTIKNSILGIPFLDLDTILEARLVTPHLNKISVGGKDTKVAEISLDFFDEDTISFFESYKLYDMKNNSEEIEREIHFKYGIDYEGIDCNPANEKDCWTIIKTNWTEFTSVKEIPRDVKKIGLFTDTFANEKIEWIPRIRGVEVEEWALWEISTATYDNVFIAAQNAAPQGLFWKDDGTKMYESGTTTNDRMYESACSDAWNLSSCSITDFIASQDSVQRGMFFSTNGSNLYEVGSGAGGDVYQYNCATAWDLSTCGFISSIPTTVDTVPFGVVFSENGSNMYIDGVTNDKYYQYTCTSPWLLSSCSPSGLNISSQVLDPADLKWKTDGTIFYGLTDGTFEGVFQYACSTPWRITSCTYDGISNLSLSGQDSTPASMFFRPDGSNFYMIGNGNDQIYQYSMEATPVPTVTLNSPVDAFNSTSVTISFNGTTSSPITLVNVTLFIDGVLNETNSSGINNTDYLFTKNVLDGSHNWTYEVCNNGVECVTATVRTFTVNTAPEINVFSPTNTTHLISTLYFNATNSTEVGSWTLNYNGTNITNFNINTTLTVEDGAHRLFLYANNSVTGILGVNDSRYFVVDTGAPALNITYPLNRSYIDNFTKTTIKSIVFNYTAEDPNLDLCVVLNITSGTNITLACTNVTFNTIYNQYTFRVTANDTFGRNSTDTEVATFDYNILQNSFNFTNITLEGAVETFTFDLNVSNGLTVTAVALIYDNVSYTTSLATSGSNVISTRDLTIPTVTTQTNISFNWNITLSDGFTYNSSSYTQTVNILRLDNCSIFTNLIYNYTLVDEEFQTVLSNTTVELNIDFFDVTRTVEILNFSQSYTENSVLVCIDGSILPSTNYSVDTIVKYEAIDYEIEYYNIVNFILSNSTIPQNITLYDLNTTDSTEFQLTFTGADYLIVENALVFVKRQYIAENNTFKVVELPKTDANGQTILHLVRNDIIYDIQIIKDGVILGNFENLIAFCEDFTIGDCKISLNAFDSVEEVFQYSEDLGLIFTAPIYNESANTITFSFTTFDGSAKTVDLNVSRHDIFGNRTVCVQSVTSASGTLQCSLNPNLDETKLKVVVEVNGQPVLTQQVLLDSSNYGAAGYLIFFMMSISIILMFSGSKSGVLFGMILSFVGAVGLGILSSEVFGLGAAGLWIMIAAILGLWKLNQNKPQ